MLVLVAALVGRSGAASAAAATPAGTAFTYQGQLRSGGTGYSGSCDFQFGLWDADSGGSQLGATLTRTAVSVTDGYFAVSLDFGSGRFAGEARWLAIAVRCPPASDGYTALAPRQPLTAAPHALYAANAALLGGQGPGAFAAAAHNHWGQSWSGGGTGLDLWGGSIGLLASGSSYGVHGTTSASSGYCSGVRGDSASTEGHGVYGEATAATGSAYGVYGLSSSTGGRGVYGGATAGSGTTFGVWGVSASTEGRGVYGYATAASGTTYGVLGSSQSTGGRGVSGEATASSGTTYGVHGRSYSTGGTGVYGYASAAGGTTHGVHGEASSPDGTGVYGWASAASGFAYGVRGVSAATDGRGVFGYATAASGTTYGVRGESLSASGTGVYGQAWSTGGGHGVYALSKGAAAGGAALWAQADHAGGIALWAQNASTDSTLVAVNQGSGDLIKAFSPAGLRFRVANSGSVYADGTFSSPAADVAEMLPAVAGLEPADLLAVALDGRLVRSSQPYQASVVGVYSARPGFLGGAEDGADLSGQVPLAVVGVVPVKATAENGPIRPGDLLVASSTPGHAMAAGPNPPVGAVIGKALAGLDVGAGIVKMLVTLQ